MKKSDLEQLIVQQIPSLRRYARALTNDSERADDLVQDSLECVWSRISLWQSGKAIRPWLFRIMHNVFANDARRYHRAQLVPLSTPDLPDEATSAQESGFRLHDLKTTLELLPLEQRQVILLIGLENLSYEEVAQVLDIPTGTVLSRLSRGRKRLRSCLAVGLSHI